MPRKRMIQPTIWTNRKFIRLSVFDRLLFIGLISNADDEGRLWNDGLSLKADIFPADKIGLDDIEESLERLRNVNLIEMNKEVIQLIGWKKHQTINRPSPSSIPEIHTRFNEHSVNDQGTLTPNLKEEKLIEGSLNEERAKESLSPEKESNNSENRPTKEKTSPEEMNRGRPDSTLQVEDLFKQAGFPDPEGQAIQFFNYYEDRDWYSGNHKIKDWTRQAQIWMQRAPSFTKIQKEEKQKNVSDNGNKSSVKSRSEFVFNEQRYQRLNEKIKRVGPAGD